MIAAPPRDVGSLLRSPNEADRLRGAELAWALDEASLKQALEEAALPCPTFEGSLRVPAALLDLAALVEVSWLHEARLTVQLPEAGANLSALAEFPALHTLCVLDPASHPGVQGLETLPIQELRWLDLGRPRERLGLPAGMREAAPGAWRPTAGRVFRR